MMAAIHLVNWLEYSRQREDYQPSKSEGDYSWGATMLTIFGAISEQGNIPLITGTSLKYSLVAAVRCEATCDRRSLIRK
jgi:hypothetical protein